MIRSFLARKYINRRFVLNSNHHATSIEHHKQLKTQEVQNRNFLSHCIKTLRYFEKNPEWPSRYSDSLLAGRPRVRMTGTNGQWREVNHSPPYVPRLKLVELYLYSPYMPSWRGQEKTSPFTSLRNGLNYLPIRHGVQWQNTTKAAVRTWTSLWKQFLLKWLSSCLAFFVLTLKTPGVQSCLCTSNLKQTLLQQSLRPHT
jgi:hypothetical protein